MLHSCLFLKWITLYVFRMGRLIIDMTYWREVKNNPALPSFSTLILRCIQCTHSGKGVI